MNYKVLSAFGLMTAALIVAGCSFTDPPPFNPRTIAEVQLQAAGESARRPMRPVPTTLQRPYELVPDPANPGKEKLQIKEDRLPPKTTFSEAKRPMTLQEIIHRTVANNGDIRVAKFDTAIDEARVTEAQARFDPTFNAGAQFNRSEGANPLNGNPFNDQRLHQWKADVGIKQVLETGTQLELKYQVAKTKVLPAPDPRFGSSFPFNPFWQNDITFQVTQPLLQDFGTEVNRARIVIAQNDQRISRLDFRLKVEEQVAKVEEAYWRLVLAEREVQIQQHLLDRTADTFIVLAKRWGTDVSNVQLSQANAAIQQRYLTLVRAKSRVQDLSDNIKQLMGDPDLPVASPTLIISSDAPVETAVHFTVTDQVEAALRNRAELAQQIIRIDSATVVTKAARNNRLPQLNLVGNASITGLGKGWQQAEHDQIYNNLFSWGLGFTFEIPIGNRAANAILRRTLLQRMQAIEGYRALVDKVVLDVKQAQREVETSWGEIVTARQARYAAADALSAVEARERLEALSPTIVQLRLDRQAALADAQRAEATAVASYNLAVSALEKAKGTVLRYNNITLQEDRPPTAN